MALQSLILPILSVFRSAGLQQASGALRSLTGNFTSLAGQIGLAAGSFASFSALSTAREFTTQAVQATSLFERNLLALNQVFEELQPRLVSFTKEVQSYGLSQSQAAQASVFLGSVLKQYGFSVNESAGQTERLVTLAQDLATTYGYDVQEALLAITALFRGEYDPIEKFGVAMKQNEVNARLAAQGLNDLEGAELANAQATARLEMLFERAGDSVGAFTRATDTLYGSQQKLNAVLGNLQVAAGEPLQKPLAEINNIFAQIFEESGPGITQIFEALGQFIDVLAPILGQLTEMLFNVIEPLQQVINLLTGVLGPAFAILEPILATVNAALDSMNSLFDAGSAILANFELIFKRMVNAMEANEVFGYYLEFFGWFLGNGNPLVQIFNLFTDAFNQLADAARAAAGEFEAYNGGAKAASAAARRAGYEARDAKDFFGEFNDQLRGVATGATDAEGKLGGLAGVFQRIDEAIAQSSAKQEMEDLGLSAAFIEEVLTRPNWKEIFGLIAEYARLASTEVQKVFVPLVGFIEFGSEAYTKQKQAELLKKINELFSVGSTTGTTKKAAKDTVKEFFDSMAEEVKKQTARELLRTKGASEGLIDAILGSEAWEKLVKRIEKGTTSLKDLQKQFNQTAAGVKELADAQAKYEADKAKYDEDVKRINDRLAAELEGIREKAAAAKLAMSDLLEGFKVLATIEQEVGRFEAQIVQMLASVESSLRSAFRNKDILEEGYNELRKYAQAELTALQQVGRQRDEFAKRYDLAKDLIDNYKRAFTAAMSLTSLFGSLKDETEKRTVTVVTSGVVKLGAALREFGVTITRSFEEPIAKIQNKSAALVDEFRNMATKARNFASNLRELQKMGLNDQLFNELVQAGVVAGGETAQALVDGGAETITEINTLFAEIDALGAGLGEQVATSLYGSGINMMDGLLAGIRSKQQELENTARTLAEAFNKEFQSKFNIQVGIAQTAAEKAATDKAASDILALGPEPVAPPNPALATLDALIANANKFIDTTKNATSAMGAIAKREIFEDLRAAIAGGAAIDISGIQAKMSSADIVAAVKPQAPNIVNNAFYIQPGNRANQNATVESLKQFINQNGNLVGYGIQ
jgi:phage-related protein